MTERDWELSSERARIKRSYEDGRKAQREADRARLEHLLEAAYSAGWSDGDRGFEGNQRLVVSRLLKGETP